jgi:hypothetical protein
VTTGSGLWGYAPLRGPLIVRRTNLGPSMLLKATRTHARILLLLALAGSSPVLCKGLYAQAPQGRLSKSGACLREAETLAGHRPVKAGGKVGAPRKIRDVRPQYPSVPPGTTVRGIWMGEALLDSKGMVSRVWTVREVEMRPPLPAFNKAIVDAIRQWEFEPLYIDSVPVPVCMTVTANINWS